MSTQKKNRIKNSNISKHSATFFSSDHLSWRVPGTWDKYMSIIQKKKLKPNGEYVIDEPQSTKLRMKSLLNLNNGLLRDVIAKDAI